MKRVVGLVLLLFIMPFVTQAQQPVSFSAGGLLAYGGAQWQANGLINRLIFFPGETVEMGLSVGMRLPDGNVTLPYKMGAVLAVKQLFTASGVQLPYDPREPWSPFVADGLPLANVNLPVTALQSSEATAITVVDDETLSFELAFRAQLPETLEPGMYAILLVGYAQLDDSPRFDWYQNRVFSTTGSGGENDVDQRLPLVLRVGDVAPPKVEWVLNQSLLPQASLSAFVNAWPFIQPPGNVNLAPALAGLSFPPVFPAGALTGRIESLGTQRPLGSDVAPIQNTTTLPLTTFLGGEVVNDTFQLIPSDSAYQVRFVNYGIYHIVLTGALPDQFGNQYQGGGTYEIAIAEPLQLLPAVPAGMTLVAREPIVLGMEVWPPLNAAAAVTVVYQPLDGSDPQRQVFTGTVQNGRLVVAEPVTFAASGTYHIRYRVEGVDAEDRFWVGETNASGVITDAVNDAPLVAHGRRGLDGYNRNPQATFDSAVYPFDAVLTETVVNTPYTGGSITYVPAAEGFRLRPVLTMQDDSGQVAARLVERLKNFVNPEGNLTELLRRDSLPVVYPSGYGLLTLSRLDGVVDVRAQASADGLYRPLTDVQGQPAGTLLTWLGGVAINDPPTTAGYAAAVFATNGDSARVVAGETQPPQLVTIFGRDGSLVSPVTAARWTVLAVPIQPLAAGLILRLTAPSGTITRLPFQAEGFGLYTVMVDAAQLSEVGVWQLQAQHADTYASLLDVRWIVTDTPRSLVSPDASVRDFGGGTATLRVDVPEGWTDLVGTVIATHAQGTLETRTVAVTGRQWVVNVTRTEWVRQQTWAARGWIRLTLALSAIDADGQRVVATRTVTFQETRVVSFE